MKARSFPAVLVIVCVAYAAAACGSSPEEDEVIAALDTVVQALVAKDPKRVWELADEPSRKGVLEAVRTLEAAQRDIPLVWEKAQDEARMALGYPLVAAAGPDDAGRGPRVLEHLVDLEKLQWSSGIMDGVAASSVVFEAGPPKRAIVHTTAGDIFGFVRDGESWRSLVLRDLVLDHPHLKELLVNAKKTKELAATRKKVWQAVLDPKQPQGAYNLARKHQTASPPDLDALFTMLDTPAQDALTSALETARAAQKKIQARLLKAQRKDAYEEQGIALMVAATSNRDLYKRWGKTPEFVKPLAATDLPDRIEGDLQGGTVKVVTESQHAIPLVRGSDGFWRLAGLAPSIEQALLPAAKKILETQ